MNVGLCTPHAYKVNPEHYRALLAMEQDCGGKHMFFHIDVDMMIIGKARNMCVEVALQHDLDVVWFIDDDILVPPHAHVLADQATSLGMVTGLYFQRQQPYLPVIYQLATEPEAQGKYWPYVDYPEASFFEVDACGAGCLAIDIEIFRELSELWAPKAAAAAEAIEDKDLSEIVGQLSPWFEFLDHRGEDMYFCERVKSLGQTIWANSEVACQHIGELHISAEHFTYMRDQGLIKKHIDPPAPTHIQLANPAQAKEEIDE